MLPLGLLLTLLSASGQASPAGLTTAESDGYLQWLHSLEQAVVARGETSLDEANLLYPFDQQAWDLDDPRPYRHLSISKAVTELEAHWNKRGNGNLNSTLMALANARNYVNLSEYDSALVWYGLAADLDTTGSFRHEIAREGLACAASANDSLAMATLLAKTFAQSDLADRQDELVLAYRWMLTSADSAGVVDLCASLSGQPEALTPRLRFWQAYALSWLGQREAALVELRRLVLSGGLSLGLSERQRSWVLVGLADNYYLLGETTVARELYRTLATSRVPALRMWGKYQVAGLDFVDHLYLRSGNGFQEVCDGKRYGSWHEQACAMVTIARELERIKAEGEPYGVANFYQR
jgi:hypothetical protein